MLHKRKCVGCNSFYESSDLIRLTKNYLNGIVFVNPNSKIFGRSVYLCYNKTCIEHAFKKKRIDKSLKTHVSGELKGQLIELKQHKS